MTEKNKYNKKGQSQGYHEWYRNNKIWYRSYFNNGKLMGYFESHTHKQTSFSIR